MRWRAVTVSKAGFEAVGKTVCTELRLKVLEWERVGLGSTGPIERREAAKSGSRPSRSIAAVARVSILIGGAGGTCRFSSTVHGVRLAGSGGLSAYHWT